MVVVYLGVVACAMAVAGPMAGLGPLPVYRIAEPWGEGGSHVSLYNSLLLNVREEFVDGGTEKYVYENEYGPNRRVVRNEGRTRDGVLFRLFEEDELDPQRLADQMSGYAASGNDGLTLGVLVDGEQRMVCKVDKEPRRTSGDSQWISVWEGRHSNGSFRFGAWQTESLRLYSMQGVLESVTFYDLETGDDSVPRYVAGRKYDASGRLISRYDVLDDFDKPQWVEVAPRDEA